VAPTTWLDRFAAIARGTGMLVLIVSLYFSAISYDEYERAPERDWRRDVARESMWRWGYAGALGLSLLALGFGHEFGRRRRVRY
jgi:hypothetical protein